MPKMMRKSSPSRGNRLWIACIVVASLTALAGTVHQDFIRHAQQGHRIQGFVYWKVQTQKPASQFTALQSKRNNAEDGTAAVNEAAEAASEQAYKLWVDQFPIAAARRDFYGLSCTRADVKRRFLALANASGTSASKALGIFGPDLWALTEPTEEILERFDALRAVADSESDVLEFLRFAPRSIGTTSASEIAERGIPNMRARAALGAGYELLISPIKLVFKVLARRTADQLECDVDEECSTEALQAADAKQDEERNVAGIAIFGPLSLFLAWVLYADEVYGGPIHSKGLCVASIIPSYNIADAEGNSRLPCNCAPLWKWYLAPQLDPNGRAFSAPSVESKNCGKKIGGAKKECDPTTSGGCVWTAEDLEKDPSTWDKKEPLYWEKVRKARNG